MKLNKPGRIYLIGLDGFNLNLFNRLESKGILPYLSGLLQKGIYGPLTSTVPPYTGPAWVSLFTGVNPGRHGIYGFTRRNPGDYDNFLLNSSHIGARRIWEYLNAQGITTGVFNTPFTYPPREVNGFMVSGMLTPSLENDCTFPPDLKPRIMELAENYIFDLQIDPERDWENRQIINRLDAEQEDKFRVLIDFIGKYDPRFLMTVFVTPDRIQHLLYKQIIQDDWNPKDGIDPSILEATLDLFAKMDQRIQELCARLSEDDVIMIASDHGFSPFKKTIYLNNWLIQEGYLKLKSGGGMVSKFFQAFNKPAIKNIIPRFIINNMRAGSSQPLIDWDRTKAYASMSMEEGIYINVKGREPMGIIDAGAEYDQLRTEIRQKILELKVSEDTTGIFKDIYRKEEVFQGRFLKNAPDLLLDFYEDGWNMSSRLLGNRIWRDWDDYPFGIHHREGIWGISGGEIQSRSHLAKAEIWDITPTILSLFGLEVPSDLDGSAINLTS